MKRLVLILALLAAPTYAADYLHQSMAITTTAAASAVLPLNSIILVQCDQDAYIKQIESATGTAATATNAVKLTAGSFYETDSKTAPYLSIKAVTTSGNCQIFRVVK